MLKKDEISTPTSCLNKAKNDEPIFVLLARDPIAEKVVRMWAKLSLGEQPYPKLLEALRLADDMKYWRRKEC